MKETDRCPNCGAEIIRKTGVKQYYCLKCGAALDEEGRQREQDAKERERREQDAKERERWEQDAKERERWEKEKKEGATVKVVRRLDVISVANVYGLLMLFFGLIMGLIYAFVGCAMEATTDIGGLGFGFGVVGIILLPLIYGAIGWISGVIGAAIYNLVARWIGGVRIELE